MAIVTIQLSTKMSKVGAQGPNVKHQLIMLIQPIVIKEELKKILLTMY